MDNILIWGSGSAYDATVTLIKYFESKGQFHVVGITSNDCYYDEIDGYPFIERMAAINSVSGQYKLYDLIGLLLSGKAVYTERIKWI